MFMCGVGVLSGLYPFAVNTLVFFSISPTSHLTNATLYAYLLHVYIYIYIYMHVHVHVGTCTCVMS